MKNFSLYFLLPALLLAGCNTTPKDFKISFTMESVKTYKQTLEITGDKSYSIHQQDLFFDTFAKKAQINTTQGKLTDEEFAELTKLLAQSRIFSMKDAYGFSEKDDSLNPLGGMMYQLDYTEGTKIKRILIRPNKTNTYPGKFPQLLQFLGAYLSGHLQKGGNS